MDSSKKSKRQNETPSKGRRPRGEDGEQTNNDENEELDNVIDGLVFEDPFEDEFEEEIIDEDDEDAMGEDNNDEEGLDDPEMEKKEVWRPGIDKLNDGEELEYDPSAYIMYHSLKAEWPCLSFDFLKDNLGDSRVRFPLTMFLVTGSQADTKDNNKITLMKLSELNKTHVKGNF